jgi:hypothetical protein
MRKSEGGDKELKNRRTRVRKGERETRKGKRYTGKKKLLLSLHF